MQTVIDHLLANEECIGDRPAVFFDDAELTWRDLADGSLRLAMLLADRGVGKGDHVVLLCSNRPAFLLWFYAILNRGAVAVTVNTGLVGDGLRYAIEKSEARTLVVEEAILDDKKSDLSPLLAGRSLIVFADEAELFASTRHVMRDSPLEGVSRDPCAIIYTSGTTGFPKAVLNSHKAYVACGTATAKLLELTLSDRFMVFLPLFHTNPQMYGAMSSLISGCALVIRPKFSATRFFDDARRFDATVFSFVGTVLSILVNRVTTEEYDHRLRACIGGGCPVSVWEAVEDRFGVRIHELYGMTEVGGWVTGNGITARRRGTCGLPRADLEITVVDSHDQHVAPGVTGEIVVRPKEPDVMFSGYFGDAAAAWAAAGNFWFHTGDVGSFDPDGFLSFHGRFKEIIRRGGENISPVEIETILLQHPLIEDAAVVGMPDPIYGEEVKAVVVSSAEMPALTVRQFLKGRVADFMLPRYVQFVTAIPKTETHKIQRNVLQKMTDGQIDVGA
jgi:crotonobetaine/carnitine-CoA ligase